MPEEVGMAQYHASFVFIATGTRAEIFKGRNGTCGGGGGGGWGTGCGQGG